MLTASRACELLSYDPATGVLRWRPRLVRASSARTDSSWNGRYAGKMAGSAHNAGYVRLAIDDHDYLAHRVIFLMVTGHWPAHEIDHINMDRSDNRWANLREATSSQNKMNRRARSHSLAGLKGVKAVRGGRKWQARCRVHGQTHFLGSFETAEAAHAAYVAFASRHAGPFARLA